jgi:hypothetical protein
MVTRLGRAVEAVLLSATRVGRDSPSILPANTSDVLEISLSVLAIEERVEVVSLNTEVVEDAGSASVIS